MQPSNAPVFYTSKDIFVLLDLQSTLWPGVILTMEILTSFEVLDSERSPAPISYTHSGFLTLILMALPVEPD